MEVVVVEVEVDVVEVVGDGWGWGGFYCLNVDVHAPVLELRGRGGGVAAKLSAFTAYGRATASPLVCSCMSQKQQQQQQQLSAFTAYGPATTSPLQTHNSTIHDTQWHKYKYKHTNFSDYHEFYNGHTSTHQTICTKAPEPKPQPR